MTRSLFAALLVVGLVGGCEDPVKVKVCAKVCQQRGGEPIWPSIEPCRARCCCSVEVPEMTFAPQQPDDGGQR